VQVGGLSARGAPVARIGGDDYEVFGTIPGEKVEVAIEIRGRTSRVALLGLREASASRVAPRCAHAAECGGCDWQHIRYDTQLQLKQASVQSLLERALGTAVVVEPTLATTGPEIDADGAPWGFRDKVHFVFGVAPSGALAMGHYRRGTRSVVPVTECPVHAPRGNATAFVLRDILVDLDVPAASPDGGGVARHVVVRVGHATGERLATLVVTRRDDKRLRVVSKRLLAAPAAPDGLYLNVHDKPNAWLFGRDTVHLHGRTRLREDVGGVSFLVSPTAFFQTNVTAAGTLVDIVTRVVREHGASRVLDLYAGAGLFALPLARGGSEVVAVEESGDAVDAGVASRDFNRIDTRACRFVSARAEDVIAGRVRGVDARFSPDAIVVDPPREGCPESVLKGVLEGHRPRVLVYVSCNPLTLARDLAMLSKARLVGPAHAPYRLDTVRPLDMFPHTPHLEVVATLVRAG
jgi:23S rRNA (uracil-5-)-methyltransferase RumA